MTGIKKSILSILFFITAGLFTRAEAQEAFRKDAYYKVMENGSLITVDSMLLLITSATKINRDAYSGALLMKKAGLLKMPAKKLGAFKEGEKKLEAAIAKDTTNAEWHFLRLIIQEHAPAILNYRAAVKNDAAIVYAAYKNFNADVRAAVMDYRKQSAALQKFNF